MKQNKKLEDLLAEFGIEHLRYAPSLSLSGGERRRLEMLGVWRLTLTLFSGRTVSWD